MSEQYAEILARLDEDVQAGVEEAYRREGYVDEDGEPSDQAMKEAAFALVMRDCVVRSKSERSKKALTRGEFYSRIFPSGPAAEEDSPDLSAVDERVLNKLLTAVWGLTQTKRTGYIQRQFEVEESTLVLCRCRVYRNADPTQAIYATDNETLILEDAIDKEIQSLVRRATSLRRDLNMIIERHPKLEKAVKSQLGLELQRIDAELTVGRPDDKPSQKRIGASSSS